MPGIFNEGRSKTVKPSSLPLNRAAKKPIDVDEPQEVQCWDGANGEWRKDEI